MTEPRTGQGITDWYSDLDPDTQGDLKGYYNDIMYDSFAGDELYQTVFAQGNWGDIKDATFETFGEVKTYINDTIFATEHQTVYEEGEYVPSVDRSIGGGPKYMDVSEYMDGTKGNIDRTLPTVYARPADPVLPQQLIMRYSSTAHLARSEHGGIDRWYGRPEGYSAQKAQEMGTPTGNIDTLGDYQRHLDQVKADRIEAGKDDFTRQMKENQKRADDIWAQRTTLKGKRDQDKYAINTIKFGNIDKSRKDEFKDIIGSNKTEDIQAWMAMSSVNNIKAANKYGKGSKSALERIKFVYDYFGGKIPTREEFEAKGDPLIEWDKDKGKSWREQNE